MQVRGQVRQLARCLFSVLLQLLLGVSIVAKSHTIEDWIGVTST